MHKAMPLVAICAALLAGCERAPERPAPPRVTQPPDFPAQESTLSVPVELSLDDIQRRLEQKTPRQLWTIDEQRRNCVPAQRVKVLGRKLKVTPDIACRIVGTVTRGRIRLVGSGDRLTITMPVKARISARDVGGVIKQETATGSAVVRANVKLGIDPAWNPHARVAIAYDWSDPPGIDLLGQRIRFIQRADKELVKVVDGLERDLEAEVARARIKPVVAAAWKQGFTVIELNRENPPAWMRITPVGIGVTRYAVAGRRLELMAVARARIETFVGDRPEAPQPTGLPRQLRSVTNTGLRFSIPVIADYAQLEPVVLRALRKLAARGISLEGVGHVEADFRKVTVYATEGGRLAVGVEAKVEPVDDRFGTRFGKANGTVWLTGVPVNEADSQVVRVRDLTIYGGADKLAADLLIQLMASEAIKAEIAAGLTEDFSRDYERVVAAAKAAIANRREGDFRLAMQVETVRHDQIRVTGTGLYLPVRVTGSGRIRYAPGR